MAIPVTESQGTKVYFVETGVDVSTSANIETALTNAKVVGCLQSDIDTTITRAVQEYKCLSSDESTKSLGPISLPNFPMNLLFDADNTGGQAEIRDMFKNRTRRTIIIELTDGDASYSTIATGEAYPTTITFEIAVSGMGEVMAMDTAVMQNSTIEMSSYPDRLYYDVSNVKA